MGSKALVNLTPCPEEGIAGEGGSPSDELKFRC